MNVLNKPFSDVVGGAATRDTAATSPEYSPVSVVSGAAAAGWQPKHHQQQQRQQQQEEEEDANSPNKSTVVGASINFVNCIIGAGCIGFGGAIAASGGFLSFLSMVFCAYLMKLSFDLLIELGLKTAGIRSSYEQLGEAAYGNIGRVGEFFYTLDVMISRVRCFL